jgi:integrase/recombinase XerC
MLLADAVAAYVADRQARGEINASTAVQIGWRLAKLVDANPGLAVGELGRQHVLDWQRATGEDRQSSRRAYLSTLRVFCAWAVDERLLGADPTARLARIAEPAPEQRYLSPGRYRRLLLVLPDDRARLIVGLMRNSGLRCAEVAAIRPADYDPAAAELRVRGKGRRRRFVDVLDDEADLLAVRLDRDPVIGLSAGRISRLVSGWMAAAGLKVEKYDGVSAHALRHTAATEYQAVCHDVRETQDFLGHANLATTDRYLAHTDRSKRRATARQAGYRRPPKAGHAVKVGLT